MSQGRIRHTIWAQSLGYLEFSDSLGDFCQCCQLGLDSTSANNCMNSQIVSTAAACAGRTSTGWNWDSRFLARASAFSRSKWAKLLCYIYTCWSGRVGICLLSNETSRGERGRGTVSDAEIVWSWMVLQQSLYQTDAPALKEPARVLKHRQQELLHSAIPKNHSSPWTTMKA